MMRMLVYMLCVLCGWSVSGQMTSDQCASVTADRCERAVQEAMLQFQTDLQIRFDNIEGSYVSQLQNLLAPVLRGCTPSAASTNKACIDNIDAYNCDTDHFKVVNCADPVPFYKEDGYFVINAAGGGDWPNGGFCTIQEPSEVCGDSYEVSLDLYNFYGKDFFFDEEIAGSLGLLYNMRDDTSFDYVYFRTHTSDACYQVGHMESGTNSFDTSSPCPSAVKAKTWFKLRIVVTSNSAKIYVDGHLVVTATPHFPTRGRTGIIVINGNENTVYFKNFRISRR